MVYTKHIQSIAITTMVLTIALGTTGYTDDRSTNAGTSSGIHWVCSTASQPWQIKDAAPLHTKADDFPGTLSLRLDRPAQTMQGWGGCFNELGWKSLRILPSEKRKEVLRSLFASDAGLGLTICRMPIGASDYADDWYSLDEVNGDLSLAHFSIDRDMDCLIPYIKECLAIQPKLKVWGSPWSPPSWMKNNKQYGAGKGENSFIQEPQYLKRTPSIWQNM